MSSSIALDSYCWEVNTVEFISKDKVDRWKRVNVVDIDDIVVFVDFVVAQNNSETQKEETHKLGDHFGGGWNWRFIYILIF